MLSITYRRWITTSSFLVGLIILFLCLTAFTPAVQQNTPTIFLTPATAAPGGTLYLGGYNLPSGNSEVWLSGELGDIPLNEVEADGLGVVRQAIAIPMDIPAGEYILFVGDPMIRHPVTIQQPPTITVSPEVGDAGTEVQFTVSNLITGTLQINFDGAPVVGPLAVNAGEYSGQFVTPHDRPSETNVSVPVEVINQVDGRLLGQSETTFYVDPPSSPPAFRFKDVEFSAVDIAPGEFFTITGQIISGGLGRGTVSLSSEEIQEMNLRVLWQGEGQAPFPINATAPQISENGAFSVLAAVPSLLNGDMTSASTNNQIGLVLDLKNQQLYYNTHMQTELSAPPPFVIKTVDKNTGQPISQAAVIINEGKFGGEVSLKRRANGIFQQGGYAVEDIAHLNSQLTTTANELWTVKDPFNCTQTNSYGRTNSVGEFEMLFDIEQYVLDSGHAEEMAVIPLETANANGGGDTHFTHPHTVEFDVVVNASYQNYSFQGNREFRLRVRYDNNHKRFYNAETNQLLDTTPLLVEMEPADTGISNLPIHLNIPGATKLQIIDDFFGFPLTEYGTFVSFADTQAFPDSMIGINRPLRVEFAYNATEYGTLQANGITLTLDDKTYPFTFVPSHELSICAGSGRYYVDIPDTHRLPARTHIGHVDVTASTGETTSVPFALTFVSAPEWIKDADLKNPHILIGWSEEDSYFVHLSADVLSANNPNSRSQLGADVPKIGRLDNEAGANGRITQSITSAQFGQINYAGGMESMALNKEDDVPVSETVHGANPIVIEKTTIPILNTGKIPLYRHTIGVPPIAGATLSADMWFTAKMTYQGRILVNPNGQNYTELRVTPSATVNVKAQLDGVVAFGLVNVGANAIPNITVDLPFCFINGTKYDGGSLFRYSLYIRWWAEAGVWPLRVSEGQRLKIFDDEQRLTGNNCPSATADILKQHAQQTDEPPISARPALATDTLGHTLAIWQSADKNLYSSSYDGIEWSAPTQVTSRHASSSPEVAFISPGRAVAVWSENSMTEEVAATANLTDTLKAQHLMYALWNGVNWSAPQNLTGPTTGDGIVALASCMNLVESCPDGGQITAVWVHDEVGDFAARNFRLYYAQYQGGAWTAPQPVDAESTATDTQPTVTYQFDMPVVGWIRDEDRSLSTLDDRYFAMRRLDGLTEIVIPDGLPYPIEEPSLAANLNGNLRLAYTFVSDFQAHLGTQRQLGTAYQQCLEFTCHWSYQLYEDEHGRAIHAETPILTLDHHGAALVNYRALGFGPNTDGERVTLPQDPVGIVVGTGELAQLKIGFDTEVVSPIYLSQDGQVNWQITAVYDPLLRTTHIAAVKDNVPELLPTSATKQVRFADPASENGLYFTSQQQYPDFAVVSIQPETLYPDAESAFFTTVTVINNGRNWSGEEEGIEMALIASWNGPAGIGETAGLTVIPVLLTGELTEVDLFVTAPSNPDVEHELYLTINPNMEAAEQIVSNNSLAIIMAGIPTPQTLTASTKQASSLVHLSWDAVDDHRVTGYRIYEQLEDGSFIPTGSTPTNGFLDLTAFFARPTTYAITAFTENGSESPLSETITVTPQSFMLWLPMATNN